MSIEFKNVGIPFKANGRLIYGKRTPNLEVRTECSVLKAENHSRISFSGNSVRSNGTGTPFKFWVPLENSFCKNVITSLFSCIEKRGPSKRRADRLKFNIRYKTIIDLINQLDLDELEGMEYGIIDRRRELIAELTGEVSEPAEKMLSH